MMIEVLRTWGSTQAPSEETVSALRSLTVAAENVDGTPPVSDQALVAVARGERELTLFTTAAERPDVGGRGSATGEHQLEGASPRVVAAGIVGAGELDLVVHPSVRGQGIATAAITRLLDPSSENVTSELRAWAHGENPAAAALLQRAGFTPVRELLRMTLDPALLPGSDDASASYPAGFHTAKFSCGGTVEGAGLSGEGLGGGTADGATGAEDAENPATAGNTATTSSLAASAAPSDVAGDITSNPLAAEWVRVNAAAFASHPEQGALTIDDFALLTQEPWFDADDLIFCFDESGGPGNEAGHVAGYAWIKTLRSTTAAAAETSDPTGTTSARTDDSSLPEASARTECELYALGVHPDFAGHGLGKALLASVLERMAEHRPQRVSLYVDGDNVRAVGLYISRGFVVEQRSEQWVRAASAH